LDLYVKGYSTQNHRRLQALEGSDSFSE
jgi:hypothetical protein